MKNVSLENHIVGDGNPCYVIAEIGNLFQNFDDAKRLIDSALEMNIDAIKFQTWDAETLTTKNNFFNFEVTGNVSQYELHKKIQISEELQFQIVDYAKQKNLMIFSAPSHINDLPLMEKLDLPIYKIGSDLACHVPLLKKIAKTGKPIILSTGMCTLNEIKQSVNTIYDEGNDKLILLHCVSNYPAKLEESNLNSIIEMKNEFNIPVGFSDHSVGTLCSLSSTILGANVLEKHMKHSKNPSSPDDIHALYPNQFAELINSIRMMEKAKGNGKKIPTDSEKINLQTNRVSIVALKSIKKGEVITNDSIDIRRPGIGIAPINYEKILGKKSKQDIEQECPIQWDMLEIDS
jgi:N-acetylneuraminate synthase